MPRIIAIDWSGAKQRSERKIWLAEAVPGDRPELLRLEDGRDRGATVEHLIEEAFNGRDLVVGLDFAFSLPAWFLETRGLRSGPELWELVTRDGERWLEECAPPFWGRPRRRCPELPEHFRRTDREVPAVGGIRPKSVFQIGGAGAVGTGSLRGMPILKRLRGAGFTIWPFDVPGTHVVLEIYPRALTGAINKGDPAACSAYLQRNYPWLDERMRARAAASEDAFDAAVSALVMATHHATLTALPRAVDGVDLLEGRIWWPIEQPGVGGRHERELGVSLSSSDAEARRLPTEESSSRPARPAGDLDRWLELVRTMLPDPVRTEAPGVLVGGDPGEVLVQVTTESIVVSRYAVRWDGHVPEDASVPVAIHALDRVSPARVARSIIRARAERIRTYRWCARCRTVNPPEWMHDESTCQGCAQRHLGVVY